MTRIKLKSQDKSVGARPTKKAGYSSDVLHAKRDRKRSEAIARNAKYAARPVEDRICDVIRFSPGSSKRQLAKLSARLPEGVNISYVLARKAVA